MGCRRNVKPEIAELKGKRLIIEAELEEGVRLSTSILKQLCSTDQVGVKRSSRIPLISRRPIQLCFLHKPSAESRSI